MVIVDGQVFHVRSDGSVRACDDEGLSPFAVMTRFAPEETVTLAQCPDPSHLTSRFDALRPSDNFFFALRAAPGARAAAGAERRHDAVSGYGLVPHLAGPLSVQFSRPTGADQQRTADHGRGAALGHCRPGHRAALRRLCAGGGRHHRRQPMLLDRHGQRRPGIAAL
jgi:Alpha-acetolactate decarboxylase